MRKKVLLDSFALLAYLKREGNYRAVKGALASSPCLMNELNVGECYYILHRARGEAEAERFLEVILPSLPIKVLSNDFGRVVEASRLKAGHALSYVDCFAAATAMSEKATLLTGDPEFRALEGLVEISWM